MKIKFSLKEETASKPIVEPYNSLREAFLLKEDYFSTDSSMLITAADKLSKLEKQLSLLTARDSNDPLYDDLVRATAEAKKLQMELQDKYGVIAKTKAEELVSRVQNGMDTEQYKIEDKKIIEELYRISESPEILDEGIGSWIKEKFLLFAIRLLPNKKLDQIIMQAHNKAISLGKNSKEKAIIEKEFPTQIPERKAKLAFLKKMIKNAPESSRIAADSKIRQLAEKTSGKVKEQQVNGKSLNASFEYISDNFNNIFEEELNEANIREPLLRHTLGRLRPPHPVALGFWQSAGAALMGSGPLSLLTGIVGGLVLAGVSILVGILIKKLVDVIQQKIEDKKYLV